MPDAGKHSVATSRKPTSDTCDGDISKGQCPLDNGFVAGPYVGLETKTVPKPNGSLSRKQSNPWHKSRTLVPKRCFARTLVLNTAGSGLLITKSKLLRLPTVRAARKNSEKHDEAADGGKLRE